MSCCLVGEDFTAEYFLNPTSDHESDSDDSETYLDDSLGSDTDIESVTSDGNGQAQAPFQWQSMAQLAAIAHQVFAEHAPAHLRLAREQHIIDRIVYYAMQAEKNEIILPSATFVRPRQTVATNLMCINSIHFEIGCRDHDGMGLIKLEAFTQAIKDLSRPIGTKHLRIDFLPFCFVGDWELAAFTDALQEKMQVDCIFEMTGLDVQWERDLRMVPQALGMKLQPLICDYEPHNDNEGIQGFFGCSYEPAANNNEIVGLDTEGNQLEILDGRYFYERHELGLHRDVRN
ncbi:MAG: hypothetical protein Q9221_006720 [Calogaya cf. arnoldii]